MNPPDNPLVTELRDARTALRHAWAALPEAVRDRPPAPGIWSPAQVLEHLARTLGQVVRLAEGLWAARPAELPRAQRGTDAPAPETRLDAHRVEDRTERLQAPDFALPDRGQPPEESWSQLAAGWARMAELAEAAAGYDTSSLKAPHPLIGLLDLEQWILFSAKHERRHAAQLAEMLEGLPG